MCTAIFAKSAKNIALVHNAAKEDLELRAVATDDLSVAAAVQDRADRHAADGITARSVVPAPIRYRSPAYFLVGRLQHMTEAKPAAQCWCLRCCQCDQFHNFEHFLVKSTEKFIVDVST
jgi:hypothetical protein